MKLEQILYNNKNDMNNSNYMKYPFLAIMNVIFLLFLTLLAFGLLLSSVTFDAYFGIAYYNTVDFSILLINALFIAIITTFVFFIYPLIKNQKTFTDWIEFVVGFIFGFTIMLFFFPPPLPQIWQFYTRESLVANSGFSLIPLLLILTYPPGLMLIGLFLLIIPFFAVIFGLSMGIHPTFWPGIAIGNMFFYVALTFNGFGPFFDLYLLLLIGFILGFLLLSKYSMTLLFEVAVVLVIIQNIGTSISIIIATLTIFFGFALFLILAFDIDTLKKNLIQFALAVATIVGFYLESGSIHNLLFITGVIFVVSFGLGQMYIADLFKNATRTVLEKWVILSLQTEDRVDLSEHESIPDLTKKEITEDSYFFIYLKYMFLKPLERKGFSVEIITEKREHKNYIKGIFISKTK